MQDHHTSRNGSVNPPATPEATQEALYWDRTPRNLTFDNRLSRDARVVGFAIIAHFDSAKSGELSNELLASSLEMSLRATKRYLRELEQFGWIRCLPKGKGTKRTIELVWNLKGDKAGTLRVGQGAAPGTLQGAAPGTLTDVLGINSECQSEPSRNTDNSGVATGPQLNLNQLADLRSQLDDNLITLQTIAKSTQPEHPDRDILLARSVALLEAMLQDTSGTKRLSDAILDASRGIHGLGPLAKALTAWQDKPDRASVARPSAYFRGILATKIKDAENDRPPGMTP